MEDIAAMKLHPQPTRMECIVGERLTAREGHPVDFLRAPPGGRGVACRRNFSGSVGLGGGL